MHMHSIGRRERDTPGRSLPRFATAKRSSAGAWPAKVPQFDGLSTPAVPTPLPGVDGSTLVERRRRDAGTVDATEWTRCVFRGTQGRAGMPAGERASVDPE